MTRMKSAGPAADQTVGTAVVLDAANHVLAAQNDAATRSAAVVAQFGDGVPYDRSRIVAETRFFMAQSAEAMLEAGKRLIVLKEHEPHGDFTEIVESQLGLSSRTARLMMQAAVKFMAPQLESKRQALAVLGKTKLFELVTEADEDLAALADGGTLAGMSMDDIDAMTSRELKAALREAREEAKTSQKMRADKDERISNLTTEVERAKRRINSAPADEATKQLLREFSDQIHGAEHAIRQSVRAGIEKLRMGELTDQAGQLDGAVIAGIAQLQAAIDNIRDEFGIAAMTAAPAAPVWVGEE